MLELTHDDVRRVRETIATLVTPFAFESLAAWRDAARRSVAALTNAHANAFLFPLEGEPLVACDADVHDAARAWQRKYRELDTGYTDTSRQRGLTVFGFEELYGDVAAFQRTPLYEDFHLPYRLLDALVIATAIPGAAMPTSINLFHENERTHFGERGRLLLSLLQPAFHAGVNAVTRAGALRRGLAVHLDTLGAAACLMDARGSSVHENPAFVALAEASSMVGMRQFAAVLARRLAAFVSAPRHRSDSLAEAGAPSRRSLVFRGREGEWTLTPTVIPEPSGWGGPLVLVLARRDSGALDDATLRGRYGLTPREVEVARALAEGLTTDAVARRFGVSVHTVRRHAEHIYAKLGVNSRSALSAFLLVRG